MSYPPKGRADYLDLGSWNARCSMCNFKRKAGELVKNWQGQWRCPVHNESRQPQDFVRAVPDVQTPPWVQPGGEVFAMAGLLCTESSDTTTWDPMSYILTETSYPLSTES